MERKGRRANIVSAWPISLRHYDLRSVVRPDPLSLRSLSICIRYTDRIRARGSSRKWRAPISFPTLQGLLPRRDISEETKKSGEVSCACKNIRVDFG